MPKNIKQVVANLTEITERKNGKENLRICTNSENQQNKKATGTSKYLGVYLRTGKNIRWSAMISLNKKTVHLGTFKTEEEAAIAYNEAAMKRN